MLSVSKKEANNSGELASTRIESSRRTSVAQREGGEGADNTTGRRENGKKFLLNNGITCRSLRLNRCSYM